MTLKLLLSAACTCLALTSIKANAAPIYYTFTGQVTSSNDGAGIIDDTFYGGNNEYSQLSFNGTAVEYVYLVDIDADGTYTQVDGDIFVSPDFVTGNGVPVDRFYTDFISGSLIDEVDGGDRNGINNVAEWDRGVEYDYTDGQPDDTSLQGGSDDAAQRVFNTNIFSNWVVGTTVTGYESGHNSDGVTSYLRSDLTITSISMELSPVPIPSAVWLFGSGLLGLIGAARRKI